MRVADLHLPIAKSRVSSLSQDIHKGVVSMQSRLSSSCLRAHQEPCTYRVQCERVISSFFIWVALTVPLMAQNGPAIPPSSTQSSTMQPQTTIQPRAVGTGSTTGPVANAANPAAINAANRGASNATNPAAQPAPNGMTAAANAVESKFQMTPEEEAYLDKVLTGWELHSGQIQTFECKITRWDYNLTFLDPNDPSKPSAVQQGEIRFAMPDKGYYRIDETPLSGTPSPELVICDGASIFNYNYSSKKIEDIPLPPEYRGKGITNCPVLPFLFGAKKDDLKRRFMMRVRSTTSPQDIIIEAYPRLADEASQYQFVQIMLNIQKNGTILPSGLKIWLPGGKIIQTYKLSDIAINKMTLPAFLQRDPFAITVPSGWERQAPAATTTTPGTRPLPGSPEAAAEAAATQPRLP